MKIIKTPLTKSEIAGLKAQQGSYLKLTIDLEKEIGVAGCILHADGEAILLREGSQQRNIWGGGIDLESRTIDTTAILNLRPNLDNNSLDIIDGEKRQSFINIIKKLFEQLWL